MALASRVLPSAFPSAKMQAAKADIFRGIVLVIEKCHGMDWSGQYRVLAVLSH
jgi:hypothetical protein